MNCFICGSWLLSPRDTCDGCGALVDRAEKNLTDLDVARSLSPIGFVGWVALGKPPIFFANGQLRFSLSKDQLFRKYLSQGFFYLLSLVSLESLLSRHIYREALSELSQEREHQAIQRNLQQAIIIEGKRQRAIRETQLAIEAAIKRNTEIRKTISRREKERTERLLLRPIPRLIRTPRQAEESARDWMRFFGFEDASLTREGPDGGVDVTSTRALAQVKMEAKPVGAPVVQSIFGIAQLEKKITLVFALSGFTPAALDFAERANIALFEFDYQGEPRPLNSRARQLWPQDL